MVIKLEKITRPDGEVSWWVRVDNKTAHHGTDEEAAMKAFDRALKENMEDHAFEEIRTARVD